MHNSGTGGLISVVIAAAGKGTRMEIGQNKQYLEVAGMPVLARTVRVFEECSRVDEIVIVANKDDVAYCIKNIVDRFGFKKVKSVVAGGETRQQSVFNGLLSVSAGSDLVLIHDGARPFIDEAGICSCIDAAKEFGAACAAVPVKDTIKSGDGMGFVTETLDRSSLWSIQTPQAFLYNRIMEAHRKAAEERFEATDDASLVEWLGYRVKLVMCSYYNIKITTKEDLAYAEAIARLID